MIGTKVQLRTKEYVVPSLSLDEVERFSLDGTLGKMPANGMTMIVQPESREAALLVLTACLKWNYPEITEAEVRKELDLENCEAAMEAVMGATRLMARARAKGEAAP